MPMSHLAERMFEVASVAMLDPGACDQLSTDADPYRPFRFSAEQPTVVHEEYTEHGYLLRETETADYFRIDLFDRNGQVISRAVFTSGHRSGVGP